LDRLRELAVILVTNGWIVAVENLDEDLDYFTIQPPEVESAQTFEKQHDRRQDNRLFTESPRSCAQDTPQKYQKILWQLEASVSKNSLIGTPSKHSR